MDYQMGYRAITLRDKESSLTNRLTDALRAAYYGEDSLRANLAAFAVIVLVVGGWLGLATALLAVKF